MAYSKYRLTTYVIGRYFYMQAAIKKST